MRSAEPDRRGRPTAAAWALVAIVAVAALLRLAFAALPRIVRMDESAYQLIARSLLAGQGYSELLGTRDLQLPPVVVYLSVAGRLLGLSPQWATAAFAHVLFGSLLLLPLYGLARRATGSRRTALIATLLAAVHPALAVSPLYWGTMTEPPYLFFVLAGLYAAWRLAADGGWRWAAALGAACGLAYLTRPEAMLYLAVGLLFVLLYRWRPRRSDWAQMGLAVLLFLLTISPYIIYLHRVTGRWMFSGKQGISMDIAWAFVNDDQVAHDQVVSSLDATGQEIMWLSTEQYDRTLIGWIREDPQRFVRQVTTNMRDTLKALFHEDLLTPWLAVLAIIGATARPLTRLRLRREGFLLLALAPLASLWAFFVLSRFLAIVTPIVLIWVALGIEHLVGWLEETGRLLWPGPARRPRRAVERFVYLLPIVVVIAGLLVGGMRVARRALAVMPFGRATVGQWLASLTPAGAAVMMRNSEIALYADLPAVALPDADWPQVLHYAGTHRARYLLVEDTDIRRFRTQLLGLLDPAHPPPGLSFVAEQAIGSRKALLYAFSGAQ